MKKTIFLMGLFCCLLIANMANASLFNFDYDGTLEEGVYEKITINISIDAGNYLNDMSLQVWFNENLMDFFQGRIYSYTEEETDLFGDTYDVEYWSPIISQDSPTKMDGLNKITDILAMESMDKMGEFDPGIVNFETAVALFFLPSVSGDFDISELVAFAGSVEGSLTEKGSSISLNDSVVSFGVTENPFAVPVPSALLLLCSGICALCGLKRKNCR